MRESFRKQPSSILSSSLKRTQALLFGAMLVVLLLVILPLYTKAADFQQRRVVIDTSIPGEVTRHSFEMRAVTSGPIGSFVFEYCTNNPFVGTPCVAPAGLDVDSASLDGQSGMSGFTINNSSTTTNRLVISRPSVAASPVDLTYVFSNITNPSTVNQTVYVRVSSHASSNGTGPITDSGAVLFATSSGVGVGGFVPPYLTFCVGVTVNFGCQGGGQGFLEAFGEFAPTTPSSTTTQFGAATNDPTGYNVFMNGQSLTSGNETINPLASSTPSSPGTPQFGINLVQNSTPSVGANIGGPGVGQATANYRQQNRFRFVDGERIAFTALPAAFNRYTVSYIVNVSEDQAPGVYSSTITYTAIASF